MNLQQLAKVLGYAGLVPFIVFSIASWTTLPQVDIAHDWLISYAAVILSFMGAIHWGVAMSKGSPIDTIELGFSVLPALLAWLALLIPALFAYGLLVLSFTTLYWADRYVNDVGLLPAWYLPMRFVLTLVVIVCMLVAALAQLMG